MSNPKGPIVPQTSNGALPPTSPESGQIPYGVLTQLANERSTAVLGHVLAILFDWIAALIMFVVHQRTSPFVRGHVVTQLNLRLTLLIPWLLLTIPLIFGLVNWGSKWSDLINYGSHYNPSAANQELFIELFNPATISLMVVLFLSEVLALVFSIIATVKANHGQGYRIPVAIPFIKG